MLLKSKGAKYVHWITNSFSVTTFPAFISSNRQSVSTADPRYPGWEMGMFPGIRQTHIYTFIYTSKSSFNWPIHLHAAFFWEVRVTHVVNIYGYVYRCIQFARCQVYTFAEIMATITLLTFLQAGHRVVIPIFSFSLPSTCMHTYFMHTIQAHFSECLFHIFPRWYFIQVNSLNHHIEGTNISICIICLLICLIASLLRLYKGASKSNWYKIHKTNNDILKLMQY